MAVSDFHVTKIRKARKPYRCEEASSRGCRRTAEIKPGTRYVYGSGVFEGMPYSWRMCLRCDRAWKRAWKRWGWKHPLDTPGLGELTGFLRDERTGRPWQHGHWCRKRAAEQRARGRPDLAEKFEAMARG